MPGAEAIYYLVRNDVHGIGRDGGRTTALFGSPGRLKGYIDMCLIDRWRQPPYSVRPGDFGFSRPLPRPRPRGVDNQRLAGAHYLDETAQPSSALFTLGSH